MALTVISIKFAIAGTPGAKFVLVLLFRHYLFLSRDFKVMKAAEQNKVQISYT